MYIACGLLEYCRGLQGEEQGHQVTDWPGGGGERERERERERQANVYTAILYTEKGPQHTESHWQPTNTHSHYTRTTALLPSVTQIRTCFDKTQPHVSKSPNDNR